MTSRQTKNLNKKTLRELSSLPLAELFSRIYEQGWWGEDSTLRYYSGPGSHDEHIVDDYTRLIKAFIQTIPTPVILDIGCGDFHIGQHFLQDASAYHACDIVERVIQQNRAKHRDPHLSFYCLNACEDALPAADLVIIRQVLQHLDNQQIQRLIDNLPQHRYLLITEHVPSGSFQANKDKPAGPDNRLRIKSGIDLRQKPFTMPHPRHQLLGEIAEPSGFGGILQTMVFETGITSAAGEQF